MSRISWNTKTWVPSHSRDIKERFCGEHLPLNLRSKRHISVNLKKREGIMYSRKMRRMREDLQMGENCKKLRVKATGTEGSGNG